MYDRVSVGGYVFEWSICAHPVDDEELELSKFRSAKAFCMLTAFTADRQNSTRRRKETPAPLITQYMAECRPWCTIEPVELGECLAQDVLCVVILWLVYIRMRES
jgi:hypothetical protein